MILTMERPHVQKTIDFRAKPPPLRLKPIRRRPPAPVATARPWGRPCPRCGKVMKWHFCPECRAKDDKDIARLEKKFKDCQSMSF